MIYFRIAIQMDQTSLWQWKSTILNTPGALFDSLKIYHRIPENRLRVFFATSREFMNEMLLRENRGFISNSVTVDQFLQSGKRICAQEIKQLESEIDLQANNELIVKSAITRKLGDTGSPSHTTSSVPSAKHFFSDAAGNNRDVNLLELMKEESERSSGGDCDTPYNFTLPTSMRQTLAWTILLAKVQRGELEP